MDRALDGVGVDTEGEGQTRLRVEVDEQDAPTELGEGRTDARDEVVLATPPFWFARAIVVGPSSRVVPLASCGAGRWSGRS